MGLTTGLRGPFWELQMCSHIQYWQFYLLMFLHAWPRNPRLCTMRMKYKKIIGKCCAITWTLIDEKKYRTNSDDICLSLYDTLWPHCPKNNLNLRITTEHDTLGANAALHFLCLGNQMPDILVSAWHHRFLSGNSDYFWQKCIIVVPCLNFPTNGKGLEEWQTNGRV